MKWLLAVALLGVASVSEAQSRWDVTLTAATGPLSTMVGRTVRVPAGPLHPFFAGQPSIHGTGGNSIYSAHVYAYQALVPDPANNGRYIYDPSLGASGVHLRLELGGTAYSSAGVPYTPSVGAFFRTTPWQTSFNGGGAYSGGTFAVSVAFVP